MNNNISKEEIINQAFQYHSRGDLDQASKYYQYFIDKGFKDHRVFSNYGAILQDLGKLTEAEIYTRKAIELNPNFIIAHSNLGNILKDLGKLKEAEFSYRKAIQLNPNLAIAHSNLGSILQDLGKLKEAEEYTRKAIQLNPDFSNAHLNLGSILQDLGKLKEAEEYTHKAIQLNPNNIMAHSNLGGILQDLGKLTEAEIYTRKAIELNPNFIIAHSNLGNILKDLGKLKEAEFSYRKAIQLNPNLAIAHSNLGGVLRDLGKLKEAEFSYRKAIELKPCKSSYFLYASCLFEKRLLDEAKKNLNKAQSFNKNEDFLLSAARSRINYAKKESTNKSKSDYLESSKRFDRIISNRTVESELLSYLYTLKNKQLNITKDARYGEGLCSTDFKLFDDTSEIISTLANDIKAICKKELKKKEIIICDSFFNIFISGSGASKHNHIKRQDKNFDLHLNKYSLVYYLNIGDQKCEDPGTLKLYEPEEEILPTNGMIVIIKGKKYHSVSYHGNKDRVMIGVNFYGF